MDLFEIATEIMKFLEELLHIVINIRSECCNTYQEDT